LLLELRDGAEDEEEDEDLDGAGVGAWMLVAAM
jgi:hypothetical protein